MAPMTDETPDTPSTTPPDETVGRAVLFKTKVEDLYRMLGEVTDRYERETRFWEAETLLDLTRAAVETLWHYLHHPEETEQPDAYTEGPLGRRVPIPESPTIEGPSWDAPEVELQYPVAFDWKNESVILATFTDTELGDDPEKWIEAGTEAAANHRNVYVFDLITRGGRVRSDGTTLETLLPPDLLERFPALATVEGTTKTTTTWEQADAVPDLVPDHDEAAHDALEARYRPFLLTITSLASVSHEWVIKAGEFFPAVMPSELAGSHDPGRLGAALAREPEAVPMGRARPGAGRGPRGGERREPPQSPTGQGERGGDAVHGHASSRVPPARAQHAGNPAGRSIP